MQLVVKQAESFVKELHFERGPIYIGTELEHQVCLPDDSVSIEHTVLCGADGTRWFAEDLTRQKKTFVNNKPIKREQLRDGDILTVGDYTIEVQLIGESKTSDPVLSAKESASKIAARPPKNIVRTFEQSDAPDLRIPAKRFKNYFGATLAIQKSHTEQDLVKTLLAVTVQQFKMFHTYIAVRKDPSKPFTCHVGKRRTGQNLKLEEFVFQDFIKEAIEQKHNILIPLLPEHRHYERIRTAVIAPILSPLGCHGVIYTDNAVDDHHYSLPDLDYLILLAIQAGSKLIDM